MPTNSDHRPLHLRAVADAGRLVTGIKAADLALPTPCADWDLRTLLAHMIGQNHGFAAAFESGDAPVETYAHRPPNPDDIAGDWTASTDRLSAALAAADPGATVRLVELNAEQPFPVPLGVTIHLIDTVIHNWDVAAAIGETYRPDDEQLTASIGVVRMIPGGPSREEPGAAFGPIVAGHTDDRWTETLALLGRDPQWHAA
jgi:uncharacterized protein (TIGR03086 family)